MAHSAWRRRAGSGFVSILIAVPQLFVRGLQLPLYLLRQVPQAGEHKERESAGKSRPN
jgi:hypothetical protein